MKSSAPIILIIGGAAALLMSGSKKGSSKRKYPKDKLVLDSECNKIKNILDFGSADFWITSRAQEIIAHGANTPEEISLSLLEEQAPHCPWRNEPKWTEFMRSIYEQLLSAVIEWSITPISEEPNTEE